jgi:hypothetical protein
MTVKEITADDQWKKLPLERLVEYLDPGAVYVFARTCKSSLAAVQAVHEGVVPARSLRCFFPPGGALFNYACDNLMWEGESMQRDGVYWLVCASSSVSVNNVEDEAVALRACGGSQLPCVWDEELCRLVVQQGQLGLLKWMRAQKPPCPCDFEACLGLAEEGGAVRAYLQMGLDLLRMCRISPEDMTATEMADAVGLIDQGADMHAKTYLGETPLHLACENGHAEVVKALLEKGAGLHATDNYSRWTPMHCARLYGHTKVVKALLEKGADVHAKTSTGSTPLHYACQEGHIEVIKALLEKIADIQAKTSNGRTPLHLACYNGHAEVVKALLEKGADVHAKDINGGTPLRDACTSGHHDIAAMLRSKGTVG